MPGQKVSNLKQQSSTITIEQQNPPAGKHAIVLILRGSTMPMMGAAWSTEQNIQTTWYPGNANDATQQVLGSRELPSTWTGEWHRTMMGHDRATYTNEFNKTTEILNPMTMRGIFDDLMRSGTLLLVTWRVEGEVANGGIYSSGNDLISDNVVNENWSIVRAGRIKSMNTPIMSHTDIQWSIQFDWNGRGGTVARTANIGGEPDLANRTAALTKKINAFIKNEVTKRSIPRTSTNLTLGKIESFGSIPSNKFTELRSIMQLQVNDFERGTSLARRLSSQPQSILAAGANFARATGHVVASSYDNITRIPTELLTSKATPIGVVRAHREVNTSLDATLLIGRESRSVANDLFKETQSSSLGERTPRKNGRNNGGTVLATYVCKQGDTPIGLSLKFFRTPDRAVDILQANRLPWHLSKFEVGKILIIPTVRNQQGANE